MERLNGQPGPTKRPLIRQRRLWIAVLLALAVGGGGLLIWKSRRSALQAKDLAAYTVVAEQGSLPGIVTASGDLAAVRSVNVSPKRGGVLQILFVDEGDRVRAGQPIALMDSGDLRDRQSEFLAQVRQAEAEYRRSLSEFDRRQKLYRQGAISQDDYVTFSTRLTTSKAALEAARQRSGQRSTERSELTIRAPFAGVITQRFADPGAFVTPTTAASANAGASSSSVVELAEGIEAVAKVPESDIGRIRVGQGASLRVDAFPDRRFAARVNRIAPRAVKSNNVTSFEVKLQLQNPPPQLRIGMNADIDFSTGELPPRTLVPTVAVVTEGGKPGVLLVGKGNEPTFQPVELGTSSGRNTQILSGLNPGTKVFIDLPPWAKKRPGG